jgi:hypothetical protein
MSLTLVKFHTLANKLKEETAHMSMRSAAVDHPAHREIVSYREHALPYIFDDLRNKPWHWFMALHMITGDNPIKEEHRGRIKEMTQDWLEWADQHGYGSL